MFPVEAAQTGSGPLIEQVGLGLTVTVLVHDPAHPLRVTPRFKVKLPADAVAMLTEGFVVAPEIVAPPAGFSDQE